MCTWSEIPHSFSKHFRVTFANYRFLLGFGVLEASMEILPSPLYLLHSLLFLKVLSYTSVSWDDCVSGRGLKWGTNPFLGGSLDHLAMMSPTIVIQSENHTKNQKRKVEDHWTLLLSAFSQRKTNSRNFQGKRFLILCPQSYIHTSSWLYRYC